MKTLLLFFIALSCIFSFSNLLAEEFISEQGAINCISINKEFEALKPKIQLSETHKAELKSKIDYLSIEIQKRRSLIEDLDKQHNQENNENYNQLIIQFENLIEERKESIQLYNSVDTQHLHQYENRLDLEKQYSQLCLDGIQISETLFKKVCTNEKSNWCGLFSF